MSSQFTPATATGAPVATVADRLGLGSLAVPSLILLGGALNGFAVQILGGGAAGAGALSLGLGPFQLIALLVAARLSILGSGESGKGFGWLEAVTLAAILVPSSAISWLAIAVYAAVEASRATDQRRLGALLFLAMALAALWSSAAMKWLAAPVTAAEAYLIGLALAPLRPDIVQIGNVIGTPGVHTLLLMTACTTLDALPKAAVALVAVAIFLGTIDRQRIWPAIAILGVLYAATNIVRMGAMAWSGEMYELAHGPIGANIFDVVQTLAVLGLGNWASRP